MKTTTVSIIRAGAFIALALVCRATFAADEEEEKTITVSNDNKPVFTIKVPSGWKATEPMTLSSIITDASMDMLCQFDKLGELDAAAAKKKAIDEAHTFILMNGDDKNAPAPDAAEREIGGKSGYGILANFSSSGKSKQLRLYAFTTDGKTYYEFVVQGPEDKMGEADAMADSISAAK
jgi:hypothetical protein